MRESGNKVAITEGQRQTNNRWVSYKELKENRPPGVWKFHLSAVEEKRKRKIN